MFPHHFRFPAVQLVLLYGWVLPGSDSTVGSKHYWSAVEESRAPRVSANPYFGVWDDVAAGGGAKKIQMENSW